MSVREQKQCLWYSMPLPSFSSFSQGLSSKVFVLLVRKQIRHFRRVRQNPLFLARDKGTVYQRHRFGIPGERERERDTERERERETETETLRERERD